MNEVALASREALWVTLQIGGPILILLLVVGLVVAVVQALTQVNEATLGFLPKVAVLAAALLLLGPFMSGVLRGYASSLFQAVVEVGLKG
ncbi:flagellar biosynthetic protein FliQ [Roseomonas sp. PWR1]|uniref:Flagellar biosynthetic protein FliQ n=1 Tax=Roseomonas nitratireducens TaxID=2820810 RepID=A0ABS4AZV8_9PROT|nr:flagellar biosynthetic protein FliQ [Neoroseomonas nitratireducens]